MNRDSERRIKVLILGLRGFPGVQGGVEAYAENLAPILLQHGLSVQVITRSPYASRDISTYNGIRLTRIWSPRKQSLEAIVHTFLGVLYAAWIRPDVLHIQAIGPALLTPLARALGLRVVVTHHGQDYRREKWGVVARAVLRIGESMGMRFANARIAVSQAIQRSVISRFGVDCEAIPNGVTVQPSATTTTILQDLGVDAEKYILMVARWVPEKRHHDLIRAFAKADLKGWKLVLAGTVDHSSEYGTVLSKLVDANANVIAAGFVSGLPLRELYSHAGLCVLPSSHEGLPIALLEALSYGVPVLASDIEANREVGLESSHYFPVGDIDTLADKLQRRAAENQSQRERNRLIELVRDRFSWQRSGDLTARVLVKVGSRS